MQVEGQDGGMNSLPFSGDGAYDVVALAASAGGLAALTRVLAAVPADFPAAIAVILSGTGTDGSMGARAIKKMGGTVIAQDETAEFFGMPSAAIETGVVDFVLPLSEIAGAILSLVRSEYVR